LRSNPIVDVPAGGEPIASSGAISARRLFSHEQYFGLEAGVVSRRGPRTLARISSQPPEQAWIDTRSLGEAFRLDAAASAALLARCSRAVASSDGTGYCPTEILREYAHACMVAPLPRARAKTLIDRACRRAARINSDWTQNPFQIEIVAVSGGYISCNDQLSELSLSLVLGRRTEARTPRSGSPLSRDDARREILEALHELSSFIVVRIVADRTAVQRPFSVVFQINENVMDSSIAGWDRFRDWSLSVTRWLAVK
jgi:hypothetical protein